MKIPKKYKVNEKKIRLIESAKKLFYENGVNNTTLASIAHLADIPLGNVYYYFKSKDSIVLSVIEYTREEIRKQFYEINNIKNAKERLKYFIKVETNGDNGIVKYGDKIGSLSQELCKKNNIISSSVANVMKEIIEWCKNQFEKLGKKDKSTRYAIILISNIQGINLLNFIFKNEDFINNYTKYLINWIEEIT